MESIMIRSTCCVLVAALSLSGCANVEEGEGDLPVQTADAAASGGVAATGGPGTFQVLFETTKGNFTVEIHPEWAPNGAQHFKELVEDGYFTECGFFRAVPNFMVQFGIAGDPAMSAKWKESIQDDPVVKSNKRGYLTYAQTGQPNSRSTQLFINFKDNSFLDAPQRGGGSGFAPIGRVIGDGMKIVDSINQEYGEPPGDAQSRLTTMGNAYLKQAMPNVDYINKVTIVSP